MIEKRKNQRIPITLHLSISDLYKDDPVVSGIHDLDSPIQLVDISKDGMMAGPNIESTSELIEKTGMDIIASGGVSTMNDVENVSKINAAGVIIGKALYNGALDLESVVKKFQ